LQIIKADLKHQIFNKVYLTASLLFAVFATNAFSDTTQQQTGQEVGIEEKLGEQVPLDASFFDETGQPVNLKSLINKPTILMLVYYRCPGICSPLMNSVSVVIDKMDMEPGKDYNLISISFDPTETYVTAAPKKFNYFDQMKKKIPADSWRFLTGDSINIARVTNAVGFHFKKQGNDYMHGTTIIALSPEGKVTRYLYGIDFLPLDVKLALTEASEGRTGPGINKLLKICFAYDPASGKYVLSMTRVIGGGMLLAVLVFVLVLTVKKKKHNIPVNGQEK
jgi:protein SCO1/2